MIKFNGSYNDLTILDLLKLNFRDLEIVRSYQSRKLINKDRILTEIEHGKDYFFNPISKSIIDL